MTRAELIAALDAEGCGDDDELFFIVESEGDLYITDRVLKCRDEDGEFFAIVS